MTIKNWKEWKFKNLFYILQAKYWRFIERQYKKRFTPSVQMSIIDRVRLCHDCFENGDCLDCGCDFDELIYSDKPCKRIENVERTGS